MIEPVRNILLWPRLHPWLFGLLLVFAISGAGAASASRWAQYHLDAARHALDRDALDEAQRHLDLCLQVPFRDASVHLIAARTARRRDAYEQAEKHLTACRQSAGMTEEIARERLLLTAQQGEMEGLEGRLQRYTGAEDAEAILVLEALAKGYANRFWHADALECLNVLLKRQPRHPQALLLRARISESIVGKGQGEHDSDALRDYELAVEVNPSFDAQLGLAGGLFRVGRPQDALREYQSLHSARPDNSQVLLGLARCRYRLNQLDEARQLLDELLAKHPDHLAALLERGRLAYHAGELEEAEKWLGRAAALAPPCAVEPLRSLSQCLKAQGKEDEARRCLDRLHKNEKDLLEVDRRILQANRYPHNLSLRYEIARDLMRLGREEEGVSAFFRVLEQQPRHGPVHAALADYFERIGQPDRAALHRRAASLGIDTPSALR